MSEQEISSHRPFFVWAMEYNMLYGPRAGENGEAACRLARVQLWDRLRPILREMAKELTTAGIDPSDAFRLSGVIPAISALRVEEVEVLLDNVWTLAKRLEAIAAAPPPQELGEWVFVEIDHMKFTGKTAADWAKNEARPYFRRTPGVARGAYECQRTHLREVVDADHWQKYGVE